MPLNLRGRAAETLSVPPSGERRLLGLLAVPVLVLDLVCAIGVAAANEGTARTVLLTLLGLCVILTLLTLTVGPSLLRSSVGQNEQTHTASATSDSFMMPAVPVQRGGPLPIVIQPPGESARSATPQQQYPAELVVAAARRNEVLVSRQLACLDQLTTDGSGSLETQAAVWRMEELAARLRRNGESLLVVAGARTERRANEPVPLSAVIATATAEIENGSRVVTTNLLDRPVRPEHVVPLGHLIAELLEKATGYAFPAGGVQVQANPVRGTNAVRVRIEDSGPGFSEADLERANLRLRNPEAVVTEEIGSLDLGLFVVSRLAPQVPCTVEMTRAESGGVCVSVDLPGSTFVAGAGAGPAEQNEPMDGAQPTFAKAPVANYTHYDDHTDLSEYAEMQGYGDLPVAESEVMPGADDFAPAGIRTGYEGMAEPPAVLADPVAVAGPVSLDQPFGANAPLLPGATQSFDRARPFDETQTPDETETLNEAQNSDEAPVLDGTGNPEGTPAPDETRALAAPEAPFEPSQTLDEPQTFDPERPLEAIEASAEAPTVEQTQVSDHLPSPEEARTAEEKPLLDETQPRRHGRRAAIPQTFFAPIEPVTAEKPAVPVESGPGSPADPLSHPPHESQSDESPARPAPRHYPTRAELRRQRRELDEGADMAAMQAGAQAAAQAAQAAGLLVRGPLPIQHSRPRAGSASPPAVPVLPVPQESVSLLEEVLNRQAREARPATPDRTGPEPSFPVPAQVTPLDDPHFQVPAEDPLAPPEQITAGPTRRARRDGPEKPAPHPEPSAEPAESTESTESAEPAESADASPIPAQAGAPEDEPGFDDTSAQPSPATAGPHGEEPPDSAPRHAATGPVPMVSANRTSLAAPPAAPGEATRQRAAHVRAMLAGLRSGSEKGRDAGGEPGVPQPRPGDNPER